MLLKLLTFSQCQGFTRLESGWMMVCRGMQARFLNLLSKQKQLNKDKQIEKIIEDHPPPTHFKDIPTDWLMGFINGDGSFIISATINPTLILGIRLQCEFQITQHQRSLYILQAVRQKLGGQLYQQRQAIWRIGQMNSLKIKQVVIPFLRYGFLGKKQGDYLFFSAVINALASKTHLNKECLQDILQCLKFGKEDYSCNQMNLLQLLKKVKTIKHKDYAFQKFENRLNVQPKTMIPWQLGPSNLITYGYVCGITDAEGCFNVQFNKLLRWPLIQPKLVFTIGCHTNSLEILNQINRYFNNQGWIGKKRQISFYVLRFGSLDVILNTIIPFFLLNPLLSSKYYDFLKFTEIAYLMKFKHHLTIKGMEKILKIAYSMNSGKESISRHRHYTLEQCIEYLNTIQSRQMFKEQKNTIPTLKSKIMVSRLEQK